MFTGIVTHRARLLDVESFGDDCRLHFTTDPQFLEDCVTGDSIAVSGVCLTALNPAEDRFSADVSAETLSVTPLGLLEPGARLNLERPLRANGRFDGHFVTGHVDGVTTLARRVEEARSTRMVFETPRSLSRFIAAKGSLCLDGVSLT
ncbi:MAG: riboflavin synthase, partial [Xanthomonadales bacterium]|nr:riboflavin synthase [Xanthomonadales bacterium]